MRLARFAAAGMCTAVVAGAAIASAATNNISTVAGTGTAGYNGDGIAATAAQLGTPVAVAATADGGYLISDQGNSRVRKVSAGGVIATVVGNGTQGFSGDGGAATSAQLNIINGVAPTADGGFLIADSQNHRIRRVAPNGTISTVAGNGQSGPTADGVAATATSLNFPSGVAPTADGGFLIADNDHFRIRKVASNGTISTVAGNGTPGFSGDGGAATSASLSDPRAVAVTSDGGFLIAETETHRVRRVAPNGTITTVAGTGTAGSGGDGGPAASAQLNNPIAIAALAGGGFLVADRLNHRVRRVAIGGTISTVAGTGTAGFSGDGGPATSGQLNNPLGVAVTAEGDYLIVDLGNSRVRHVDAGDPAAPPPPPPLDDDALPPPRLGRTVNVREVSGRVYYAIPPRATAAGVRTSQKGLRFRPLREARQLPVRSFLQTRRGSVRLTSARPRAGKTQSGIFTSGLFQILQSRKKRAKGLTELRLKGSSFRRCKPRARKPGKDASAAISRRRIRRLRARGRGRFRTRGRYSAATVRGTKWLTQDRCDGTLTKVTQGRVAVRDFRRKRTILVKRGKSYLANARAAKRR